MLRSLVGSEMCIRDRAEDDCVGTIRYAHVYVCLVRSLFLCRLDPLRTISSSLFILRLHSLLCPSPECAAFSACSSSRCGTSDSELLGYKASWWCTPLLHQISPTWDGRFLSLRLVPLFVTFFNNHLSPACRIGVKIPPVLHVPWSARTRTTPCFQNF